VCIYVGQIKILLHDARYNEYKDMLHLILLVELFESSEQLIIQGLGSKGF